MKQALVLEKDPANCNAVSALLASLGYLVTPVFRARKALLAAQLIHFDLIVIHTTAIPEDRRSLAAELKRCSPLSVLVLSTDPDCEACAEAGSDCSSVDAVLQRPLTAHALQAATDRSRAHDHPPAAMRRKAAERRAGSSN